MTILEGILSGDPELKEIFGSQRIENFQNQYKSWDSSIDEVRANPLCRHMTQEELEEYIELTSPLPSL